MTPTMVYANVDLAYLPIVNAMGSPPHPESVGRGAGGARSQPLSEGPTSQPPESRVNDASLAAASTSSPLVTVITVCFNSGAVLSPTIESVLAQTFSRIEYVVIDGGSTDGSLELLRDYEPNFAGRMHWFSEPDAGIYDAMNKGVRRAHGDYVAFVNSGDWYERNGIELLVQAAETAHYDIAFGGMYRHGGALGEFVESCPAQPMSLEPLMRSMPACHEAILFRRDLHDRFGDYRVDYKVAGDYEFLLRCLKSGATTVRVDAPIVHYVLGGASDRDAAEVEREYAAVRVEYGAGPATERLRSEKSITTGRVYGCLVKIPLVGGLVQAAYERRRERRRR
jgi:glycosyltransferase involved in cell wall biosynthesis